jgi:glycosyltransferase involved in cell wall biosynthesis
LGGIVTPSKGVKLDLIENFHAPPSRITTIQNGFNLESNMVRVMESVAVPKDCPWVVSACRLSAEKDFDTLLRAFRKVRNVCRAKLLIVGDGALRDDIVALGRELELGDDLLLLGHKSNPFPYMAMADVFVLSSHHEGFGNVIVEAMSVGTPVVATDCPFGPREIIVDGENGFLVPVKDAGLMAKRCLLLIQDSELRGSMGHHAKSRSRDFSMERMGMQFEDYLDCLLRRS